MVSFFNTFLTYLLLVVIMVVVAICGVFAGKKLRDRKDAGKNAETGTDSQNGSGE